MATARKYDDMDGLRYQVEQLRREAALRRMPTSETIEEMRKFCEQNLENDFLITGFEKQLDNPFREKGGCSVL